MHVFMDSRSTVRPEQGKTKITMPTYVIINLVKVKQRKCNDKKQKNDINDYKCLQLLIRAMEGRNSGIVFLKC